MNTPIEKAARNGGAPIKFFLTEDMLPDGETVKQLETLAETAGVIGHVAVLPDVHRKSRNMTPTGTAIATKDVIVPRAIDTGICCGMRMIRTEINATEFNVSLLDALFDELRQAIPVYEHEEQNLSIDEVQDILVQGGKWSQKRFNLSDTEMACIEDGGTVPTDAATVEQIMAGVPRKSLRKGRKVLGTIGDGNHFLELQEITGILNEEIAAKLGLKKGQVFFMLHTGSRAVGSKMMKGFLKENEDRLKNGSNTPIWTLDANSAEGQNYARAVAAVSNFGFANRIAITEKLRAAVRKTLHDQNLPMPLLYDCAHVSIKPARIEGDKVWVHRHGASSALPASEMQSHPVFSSTGQPLPIPGSMGHASYVGVVDEGARQAFFSVNHGAGRVMDKPEAGTAFTESQVESELQNKNIRLYRYHSDNIAEQAPGSFKDISQIINAMQQLRLAKPVVKLQPIAVLKG